MILGDIGAALVDQGLDHRLHLLDIFGGARLMRRRQAAERGHIPVVLRGGLLGQLADGVVGRHVGILLGRPRVDLVVHIGDVADIGDMVFAV